MKTLLLTIAVGPEYSRIGQLTHPSLRRYAERIGADFRAITEPRLAVTTPHWEKFQIAELLDEYDRVLYMDTDLIVREDCPSLFDVVPEDRLGMFNEAPFAPRSLELLIDCCRQYGVSLPGWDGKYYNSGVMVISRRHQHLFRKPEKEVVSFYEQTYLNMKLALHQVPMHDLRHEYNRMTCMDAVIGQHRLACPVVHYAGALYSLSVNALCQLIADDLQRWAKDGPDHHYGTNIYVTVNGGLGDQLCAEPAIRFMREEQYPDDLFVVSTHWPRAFAHLTGMGVTVMENNRPQGVFPDTPFYRVNTLPEPSELQWRIVSHLLCHSVDYTSMALMHRTLPMHRKTPHFEVWPRDRARVQALLAGVDVSRVVAVHAGRHWNSKTFPQAWWQAVVDGLARDRTVVLVGKTEQTTDASLRGTVPVTCPEGGVDLRERLDLGGLAALLEAAPVLVTNDSAPVHLAGSFDNRIVLVPSCKHPDHILPFRHGRLDYKAVAVYKRLVIDDVEARPTQAYETTADPPGIDWSRYLPEQEAVVEVTCRSC